MKPTVQIVQVTPEMAKAILSGNINNRSLRPSVVEHYARMMKDGQWHLNGESISIAPDGRLLNGQHRMEAVVRSGVTVGMVLVTNVDPRAFSTYDKQTGRTTGDALKIAGIQNYSIVSAMIGVVKEVRLAFVNGSYSSLSRGHRMSDAEVIDFALDKAEAVQWSAMVGGRVWHAFGKGAVSPAVAGAMHMLFAETSRDAADTFFARLTDGAGLDIDSPVLTLRNRLLGRTQSKNKSGRGEITEWFIRAWNAYRAGSPLRLVKAMDGKYPLIRP